MKRTKKGRTKEDALSSPKLFCKRGHNLLPSGPNFSLQCSGDLVEYWSIVCRQCNKDQAKLWRQRQLKPVRTL